MALELCCISPCGAPLRLPERTIRRFSSGEALKKAAFVAKVKAISSTNKTSKAVVKPRKAK